MAFLYLIISSFLWYNRRYKNEIKVNMRNIVKKIAIVFVFVLIAAILLSLFIYSRDVLLDLIFVFEEFIEQHLILAPIAFVLISAISMLLGMISSVPIVPLAVVVWGTTATILMLLFGWLAGGCLSYVIGRYAGYPLVGAIVGRQRLEKWISGLKPRMNFPLLLLFRLAAPSETGYVFGIFRYNFWLYLLITFLAELPVALLVVYASDALIQTNWQLLAILLLVGVILIMLAYRLFNSRFNSKETSNI